MTGIQACTALWRCGRFRSGIPIREHVGQQRGVAVSRPSVPLQEPSELLPDEPVERGDERLLAGGWNRPRPDGEPAMEPEKYLQFISNTSNHVSNAAGDVAEAGMDGEWWGADHAAARFVARNVGVAMIDHIRNA